MDRRAVGMRTEHGGLQPVVGEVYVQHTSRVPAGALAAAFELIQSNDQIGTMAKDGDALDALVKAFSIGWLIGGAIEEEFDLGDKISDWMIDFFGPWPF